eukprot:6192956-Pleurochrysis_carterae.AAC.1
MPAPAPGTVSLPVTVSVREGNAVATGREGRAGVRAKCPPEAQTHVRTATHAHAPKCPPIVDAGVRAYTPHKSQNSP